MNIKLKIFILFIFSMQCVGTYAQTCPIVNDTFTIDNFGTPVYISYLRNATNPALKTTLYNYASSMGPYAWAHTSNTSYPVVDIESSNRHYTSGGADVIGVAPIALTQNTPGSVLPGSYIEVGTYPNTSSPVPSGLTEKQVRLEIPAYFYGYASFDYYAQSCSPYTYGYYYVYNYCYTYSTYLQIAYTTVITQYVNTYMCTDVTTLVCTSYTLIPSTVYNGATVYDCVDYTTALDYATAVNPGYCPDGGTARTTCTKKIYLYVRAPLDVTINKACSKSTYSAGELIKFTIDVATPLYSEVVDSGIVEDILPAGINFVGYTSTGGTYNPVTGQWKLPKIGNGKTVSITISAIATESGTYTNTARFYFQHRLDADSSNNTSSCTFNATVNPDISRIKPPYPCGNTITGNTPVCADSVGIVFSVSPIPVPGATYTWSVPSGYSILSGAGTNSIVLRAGRISGRVSATIHIPATDSTSTTTCERSFPINISTIGTNIRITNP